MRRVCELQLSGYILLSRRADDWNEVALMLNDCSDEYAGRDLPLKARAGIGLRTPTRKKSVTGLELTESEG